MKLTTHLKFVWLAAITLLLGLGTALPSRANSIDMARYGMIWTQTASAVATEDFTSIDDVFLNGGLDTAGHKLAMGYYYVTITTDLAGLNKIATSYPAKPVYVNSLGVFQLPYKLLGTGGIFPSLILQNDTYYYVWIGKNPFTYPPCYPEVDRCRFRIIQTTEQGASLNAFKYWDRNGNGRWDAGAPDFEPPIEGWAISVYDASDNLIETKQTDVNGQASFAVDAGDYTVREESRTGWEPTTPVSVDVTVPVDGSATVYFGNRMVEEIQHNGRTPGFWQGPQGQKLVDADDLLALRNLNLVDINGNPFDPTTFDQLSDWLNSHPQNLMAHKLSRFLAAMTLNVRHGFVSGSAQVDAGPLGIMTISDLLTQANAALVPPWNVTLQTELKDALDAACNNTNWVI